MTPATLNETSKARIAARVAAVLGNEDRGAATGQPPLATFITFYVLDVVWTELTNRDNLRQLGSWRKQAALARVAADLTGDTVPAEELAYVGQNASLWLDRRRQERTKQRKAESAAAGRARKKNTPVAASKLPGRGTLPSAFAPCTKRPPCAATPAPASAPPVLGRPPAGSRAPRSAIRSCIPA